MSTKPGQVHFLDYALFSGSIRHHAAKTLEEAFRADPNPVHRRLHILNLFKEAWAAYEDLGAMLDSLLEYRTGRIAVPLARLISFGPGDVQLDRVFKRHDITSGDDLYARLKLDDWIPPQWAEWFPALDLRKSLVLACRWFLERGPIQTEVSVAAYNKIKHGLLVVPSAKVYVGAMPDAPAAIFKNTNARVNAGGSPFALVPLDMSDESLHAHYAVIEFTQCDLRLLAALYVTWRYPDFLKNRGIPDPKELFACPEFTDIRHLIAELTQKKQL